MRLLRLRHDDGFEPEGSPHRRPWENRRQSEAKVAIKSDDDNDDDNNDDHDDERDRTYRKVNAGANRRFAATRKSFLLRHLRLGVWRS